MKKMLSLMVVAAFIVCLPLIAGSHGEGKDTKGKRVFCCHEKGKCDNIHTRAECEKEGGKVVTTCKECK